MVKTPAKLYRSAPFRVRPGEFPADPVGVDGSLPWARTRCPVAERAAHEESVWLPHQLLLGPERDVDDIVTAIEKIRLWPGWGKTLPPVE